MSHFTVTIAVPGDVPAFELDGTLDGILEPYYEGKETPRYLSKTRQQIIDEQRKEMHEYATEGLFAKYSADPDAYIASTNNLGHLKYLGAPEEKLAPIREKLFSSNDFFDKINLDSDREEEEDTSPERKERVALLDMSFPDRYAHVDDDDFVYKLGALWYEDEELDEEGNAYSEYNPLSKWDWFTVGGRWAGYFNATNLGEKFDTFYGETYTEYANDGLDRIRVGELKDDIRPTFAFVGLDGQWNQRGQMGWFGMSTDEQTQEEWEAGYNAWIASLPADTWLVLVDAHI